MKRKWRDAKGTWLVKPLAVLLALGLGGCGADPAPATTPKADTSADSEEEEDASAADTATADSVGAEDTAAADAGSTDVAPSDAAAGDAADNNCVTDDQCAIKLAATLKLCERAVCDKATSQCKTATKPGFCCDDSVCDDKNPGTEEKCNLETAQCEYKTVPGYCPDKLYLLKTAFEQKSFEGFQATEGTGNGNVKWQVESKRTHSGKGALYFGNECYTYDNGMTAAKSCVASGAGTAIQTSLKSPTLTLPAGKQAILHFWLWLDAQPSYLDLPGAVKGVCKTACASDEVCLADKSFPDGNMCLKEKDLLKIKIGNEELQWNSLAIGKSTKGAWKHIVVDLAKYTGQGVSITWEFKTTDGLKNAFEGIYLDDITVETLCADTGTLCDSGKPCTPDSSPCTDDACTAFVNSSGGAGLCFFDKTPSCCTGAVDCDDNNDCSLDSCVKGSGDAKGVCKNVPNAANKQCCQPETFVTDGFENTLSTWTATSNSQTVKWQTHPGGGTNGTTSLYFGDATFNAYDDPSVQPKGKGPQGVICSKAIKLPTGTLYNSMNFQLNLSTEWDGQPAEKYKNPLVAGEPKVDELTVLVKSAGQFCGASECRAPGTGLPAGLWSSDSIAGTTNGQWLPIAVALDKYAGKEVEVCFAFDAGDSISNKAKGVEIDDVSIGVTCSEQACTYNAQCATKCSKCETPLCQDGTCLCQPIASCCAKDADCDDGDTCTTDKCNAAAVGSTPSCTHTLTSPTCCSNKTSLNEDGENSGGSLPGGWKASFLSGVPGNSGGKPYSKLITWSMSPLKAYANSQYALYFGTNGVTYNAGNEVPAAVVRSGEVTLPVNGTALLTFQLYLSTEWNPTGPNYVFKAPQDPIVIDRLRVGLYDPNEKDPAKNSAWLWNSYQIDGSTNGKWRAVVIKVPDAWKGKAVKLQFEFDAGTTSNNAYEGAFIDDVQVSSVCDKPACLEDAECTPLSGADACKSYFCTKDPKALLFACQSDFKPGPGCCASNVAVPTETFESADMAKSQWVASEPNGNVQWQVSPKTFLNGKYEAYFGNPDAKNYADGDKKVSGTLDLAKSFTLSTDPKKNAALTFKMYLDIEKSFETFQVRVSIPGANVTNEVIWDHQVPANFNAATEMKQIVEKKIDLAKYKGKGAIKVNFFFDSQDGKKNTDFKGIYLDDISVLETCL